ncbi:MULTISPECIES: FAD/NAD(P)-binding protein [unclassified Luteimonas]|uniref:FAD/NAD(P)-binding protein n=1 Tax=unclassified Luteimonas TaxID=2629088 RepID=UPI0018F0C72E|nr:FAD/NAD(P)-binding protein [Luteimonas sp. MC1750]MBJ6978960.1 FAD/NAD(P)-binding protein [Luteimonas sp. MC1895]MBJ6984999.1 FAD/NAD(P)-binding protein [Luteimonas sp. MC1750]QQO05668.1 FAD/NAD(P)-binding protein [Luteimonas sp. MC1750]
MTSPVPSRVDVAVIGGGASGTLVAAHLLGAGAAPLSVALVQADAAVGEGVAYATRRPEHLLNVRAAGMSALDANPGDFVGFLQSLPAHAGDDPAALGARFLPRQTYAGYLAALLDGRPGRARLQQVVDPAVDVSPADGSYLVELASGQRLQARTVVLAVGNRPARLPLPAPGAAAVGAVEAWDYPAIAAIAPDADVAILGAGLSMVDVVLSLVANDHRGRITSLSRRGLVPLPHAAPAPPAAADIPALLAMGLAARTRALRALAAHEEAHGRPWQGALDALRPHVQALWTSLDATAQARFLRHLVRHWDVHRHRIAPEVAAQLDAATAAGQLQRLAGHLVAIEPGARTAIAWRPRGRDVVERFEADVVVNALGMEKRIDRGSGLLAGLCARGLLRPGPHGMGAATVGEGVPLDAAGAPVPGLWTLGTLRIGDLWETIAMPELRGQARRVADAVRAHLGP